jgi:hypothetical protein
LDRFSADMDFSTPEKIDDDKVFFDKVRELLQAEFLGVDPISCCKLFTLFFLYASKT